jgi:hypothetical protein
VVLVIIVCECPERRGVRVAFFMDLILCLAVAASKSGGIESSSAAWEFDVFYLLVKACNLYQGCIKTGFLPVSYRQMRPKYRWFLLNCKRFNC